MPTVDDLLKKHPSLYDGLPYIECGSGWYQILENLSQEIEAILVKDPSLGPVKVGQIKEKFGGLRYYLDEGGSPEIYKAIEKAEKLSEYTCEVCGEPGKSRQGGWIKVLCNAHHEDREKKNA